MEEEPVDLEREIRSACEARDFDAAGTLAIEAYAEEIFGFLSVRLRSVSDAQEAFSMFAEDLWIGLPQFAWRCSLRTWAYTLARNAGNRYAVSPHNRRARNVPLSKTDRLSAMIHRMRTVTRSYQRTDFKDRLRALRERLDPEDQMLLMLRIDRDMAWRDIALAMAGNSNLDDEAIARESARCRKAFERVKIELRRMAEEEGLLAPR